MVTRRRFRSFFTALGLYIMAALLIGYFGINAYTGDHGLKAREAIGQQYGELALERERLKAERVVWERRVALLRADRLDPDMLDERARALLNLAHPGDLVLLKRP